MVRDADTPAITPSFTSMLPAFSGSFTDANGFTGAAISKPAVSLRQPSPDTVHTSPGCSKQRSFTLAGMTKPESIWPTAPVNPLASVKLPLSAGSIDVKDGVMAGVSASLTLSGAYQIRACGLAGGAVGLRFQKRKGATLRTDVTASASASVQVGGADLLAALMGAIAKSQPDPKLLAGLTGAETETFNAALQEGVNHAVQASLDLALSSTADDETIFEYEIQPGALDAASTSAVNGALHGDLTALTGLPPSAGVTLRTSVLTRMRSRGVTLKVNLLGIV